MTSMYFKTEAPRTSSMYGKTEQDLRDNFYRKQEYPDPKIPKRPIETTSGPRTPPKQSPLEKKVRPQDLNSVERKMIGDEAYRRVSGGIPMDSESLISYATTRTRRRGMGSGMGSRATMFHNPSALQPK